MDGETVGTSSCTIASGGTHDDTRGRAIRDPTDALAEGGDEIGGVDPGIKARNSTCTRFINGSIVMDISSRSSDRSNKPRRSSGGTDTSRIS